MVTLTLSLRNELRHFAINGGPSPTSSVCHTVRLPSLCAAAATAAVEVPTGGFHRGVCAVGGRPEAAGRGSRGKCGHLLVVLEA
jgi:hypothetical protein